MRHPRAFSDEMLDTFERAEALRIAGAGSDEASDAESDAFHDLSKHLQLKLLGLPFWSMCGGIFDTDKPDGSENDPVRQADQELFFDLRCQLIAAVEVRRSHSKGNR